VGFSIMTAVPVLAVTVGTADIWMAVVILVLILLAGVLAVAETSMTRMSRARAAGLVDKGVRNADRLQSVLDNLERDLNAVFLAVNILQTVQAALTGVLAARLFGTFGVVVGVVLNVVVVFVVAEAAPKTWALQNTQRAALLTAPLVALVGRSLRLVARALIGLANIILPGKGLAKGPFVTEEELIALASEAAQGGGIEESERDLIESIIEFGDTVAREIMVPRTDMVTMHVDHRITDMVEVALLNGLSRFPVYGESVDDIVGMVFAKELMSAERDGRGEAAVSTITRDAFFVPETKRVVELMAEMRTRSTHIAVVIDEYGGTAGLVTLEDLLEELVGEISDEFDLEVPTIEVLSPTVIVVHDPSINVDDLNDEYDLALPDGEWDSVGGLVFSQLGRLPEVGDLVEVPGAGLRVEKMDGRRVSQIRIELSEPAVSAGDEGGTP